MQLEDLEHEGMQNKWTWLLEYLDKESKIVREWLDTVFNGTRSYGKGSMKGSRKANLGEEIWVNFVGSELLVKPLNSGTFWWSLEVYGEYKCARENSEWLRNVDVKGSSECLMLLSKSKGCIIFWMYNWSLEYVGSFIHNLLLSLLKQQIHTVDRHFADL